MTICDVLFSWSVVLGMSPVNGAKFFWAPRLKNGN
jgi:hypothetical protein